ncbi:unnamed protein product, partial [Hapterophycus canaliculatus]
LEEEAGRFPRRRMVTSVSVARQRRRNRRRPVAHRGLALAPRLLAWSGAASSRRRLLLLVLGACGTGAFVSARLLSWASSSSSSSLLPRSALPPPLPPRSDAAAARSGEDTEGRAHQRGPGAAVSLGADAIPSVLLVERRTPSMAGHSGPARPGGSRKASGLGEGSAAGGETLEGRREKGDDEEEDHNHQHRCLNTLQGMTLVADSDGRVCRRTELDDVHRPGCCAAGPLLLRREADGGGHGTSGARGQGSLLQGRHAGRVGPASISTTATETEGARAGAEEWGGQLELLALPQAMYGGAAAPTAPLIGGGGGGGGGGRGRGRVESDGFPPIQALSTPFSCWSCDVGGRGGAERGDGSLSSSCCRLYELCVSCCQAPGRREEREAIGAAAALSGHPAYRELRGLVDGTEEARRREGEGKRESKEEVEEEERRRAREEAFAHCAFRCRTYSGSVAHENSYRSPLKHCFGRFRPPAEAGLAAGLLAAEGGDGGKLVRVEGGRLPPPLQLDPFLVGLKDAPSPHRM